MAINAGWCWVPDSINGAAGYWNGSMLLYKFPGSVLNRKTIGPSDYQATIDECHLHVRTDQPDTAHVTWQLTLPNGNQASFWQWFAVNPETGTWRYDNNAGAGGINAADPTFKEADLNTIDVDTQAESTFLITELATGIRESTSNQRNIIGNQKGFPIGWTHAPEVVGGSTGAQRETDVVYAFAGGTKAGVYVADKCELVLTPAFENFAHVNWHLVKAGSKPTDDRTLSELDVTCWYKLDSKTWAATRDKSSVSADGSEPGDKAAADTALAALWGVSDGITGTLKSA